MTDLNELLIAEYNAHQARYRQLTEQAVWLQNYALIYAAVIWTWLLAVDNPFVSQVALWLPLVITLLFATKAMFLHSVVTNIEQRLAKIEDRLGAKEIGWYSTKDNQGDSAGTTEDDQADSKARPAKPHYLFKKWVFGYWLLLLLINIGMSLVGTISPQRLWG